MHMHGKTYFELLMLIWFISLIDTIQELQELLKKIFQTKKGSKLCLIFCIFYILCLISIS